MEDNGDLEVLAQAGAEPQPVGATAPLSSGAVSARAARVAAVLVALVLAAAMATVGFSIQRLEKRVAALESSSAEMTGAPGSNERMARIEAELAELERSVHRVNVPDLVGLSLREAQIVVRAVGLVVVVDQESTSLQPASVVRSQRPDPGELVTRGERVIIFTGD